MRLSLRPHCLVLLALGLAACAEDKKPDEARTAQGEILPGSASDAMIPLDSVRSQPPLAPPSEASGKGGKASSGGGTSDVEAGAAASEDDGASAAGAAPTFRPTVAAEPVE